MPSTEVCRYVGVAQIASPLRAGVLAIVPVLKAAKAESLATPAAAYALENPVANWNRSRTASVAMRVMLYACTCEPPTAEIPVTPSMVAMWCVKLVPL